MFELSEEHKQIRDMARDFARGEVMPGAAERDEADAQIDGRDDTPRFVELRGPAYPRQRLQRWQRLQRVCRAHLRVCSAKSKFPYWCLTRMGFALSAFL